MTTHQLFPTPIWVQDLEGETLKNVTEELDRVVPLLNAEGNPWDDRVRTTFDFQGVKDLETHELKHTTDAIFTGMWAWLKELGYPPDQFGLAESWFNFYDQGSFMYEHVHPERRISGCYYYKTNREDGAIKFKNPNPAMLNRLWPSDRLPWLQHEAIEPREGRLVLFPSWLTHRVGLNTTDHTRISISFNIV
jgi:uncharacterized protein (TIGR02466 family)